MIFHSIKNCPHIEKENNFCGKISLRKSLEASPLSVAVNDGQKTINLCFRHKNM